MPLTPDTLEGMVRKHNLPLEVFSDGRPNWRRRTADFAGNCSNPVTVELYARPSRRGRKYVNIPQDGMSMTVQLNVRCRKCENCLRKRAAHWRIRAFAEFRASQAVGARTWFGTLTLSPESRMLVLNLARRGKFRVPNWEQGLDFDALDDEQQFRAKHAIISDELTKFVKRVRKNSGSVIRILVVAEAHKDGEPHYHLLVHETEPDKPVRQKILTAAWKWGFSHFTLCRDNRQAAYVCKYLSKSSLARVRASLDYGEATSLDIVKREQLFTQKSDPKGAGSDLAPKHDGEGK